MDISEQVVGVIIGGLLALLTTILNQFLEIKREKQRNILEMKKLRLQEQIKYDLDKLRRIDDEKEKNIRLVQEYQHLEKKPIFNGLDLSGANLSGLDLRGIQMRGTNLSNVQMRYCCLANADLEGADCQNGDFKASDFQNAKLSSADFSYSSLQNTLLIDANMEGIILIKANLTGSQVKKESLLEAILDQTILSDGNLYISHN